MPKFSHNLSEVVTQLDAKIAELEEKQTAIQDSLSRGVGMVINTTALQQVATSLASAQVARSGLMKSCCGQNCEIDYAEY